MLHPTFDHKIEQKREKWWRVPGAHPAKNDGLCGESYIVPPVRLKRLGDMVLARRCDVFALPHYVNAKCSVSLGLETWKSVFSRIIGRRAEIYPSKQRSTTERSFAIGEGL